MSIILFFIFFQYVFMVLNMKLILNYKRFQIWDIVVIVIGVLTSNFIIGFNQLLSAIVMFLLLGAYMYFCTSKIRTTIVALGMSYLLILFTDHFSDVLESFLQFKSFGLGLFIILGTLLTIILDRLLSYSRKRSEYLGMKVSTVEAAMTLVITITLSVLIFFTEIQRGNQLSNIIYNSIFVFLIISICFVIYYVRVRETKRKFELHSQKQRIENDNRYIKEMEKHYNELRKFRHDYQNILLSLDEYIKTDDMEGLKTYYDEAIKPTSIKLSSEKYLLEDLSRIKNKEIKSIFFNKLYSAQMSDIKVVFEARQELADFHTNTLDLVMSLGIILDNAIEETQTHTAGNILAGVMSDEKSIMIVVQNSLRNNAPPVWKMKMPGFTTKGNGHGMGLVNLTEIINRDDNLTLETMISNGNFIQKLNIDITRPNTHR
ncbi:GHKL domain-containing protein [Companilactobacillus nantensis]|uniref:Histidine protein kinase n=2 Tax=Companilactobacillus nantensis TaxID=305793 RepID=A0A0R1WUW5_9LACO|nr:GHKL domain-containing protein [Companilactobacillus nantensis]KRM18188.1 histidine protein kinase [Companilactobacillus nantensis DSM 16982]GEO62847.1 histidine kinase [Companilactobacillus nantensis]